MTQEKPESRPNAHTALVEWNKIRSTISTVSALWRLRYRDEGRAGKVIFDAISLALTGMSIPRRLYRWFTGS